MGQSLADQLQRIASGDRGAFAAFYEQRFDQSLALARRAARGDDQESHDIVHDVMIKLIHKTPRIETEAQLGAWLKRVTLTTALDRARAERRRAARERAAEHPGPSEPEDRARTEWLRAQLAELDPEALAILEMRHRFAWTLARIGEVLGITPGAADRKLRTAHTRLAERAMEGTRDD